MTLHVDLMPQVARLAEAKRLGEAHFYLMEVTSDVYIDARHKVRSTPRVR